MAIGIRESADDNPIRARVGQIAGLHFTCEPKKLRFFLGRLEPLT